MTATPSATFDELVAAHARDEGIECLLCWDTHYTNATSEWCTACSGPSSAEYFDPALVANVQWPPPRVRPPPPAPLAPPLPSPPRSPPPLTLLPLGLPSPSLSPQAPIELSALPPPPPSPISPISVGSVASTVALDACDCKRPDDCRVEECWLCSSEERSDDEESMPALAPIDDETRPASSPAAFPEPPPLLRMNAMNVWGVETGDPSRTFEMAFRQARNERRPHS